jgi:hypothetical protein
MADELHTQTNSTGTELVHSGYVADTTKEIMRLRAENETYKRDWNRAMDELAEMRAELAALRAVPTSEEVQQGLIAEIDEQVGAQYSVSYLWELLRRARERLAELQRGVLDAGIAQVNYERALAAAKQMDAETLATCQHWIAEYNAATARAEANAKDAARYRWIVLQLDEQLEDLSPLAQRAWELLISTGTTKHVLDAAIDAALAQAQPEPQGGDQGNQTMTWIDQASAKPGSGQT